MAKKVYHFELANFIEFSVAASSGRKAWKKAAEELLPTEIARKGRNGWGNVTQVGWDDEPEDPESDADFVAD